MAGTTRLELATSAVTEAGTVGLIGHARQHFVQRIVQRLHYAYTPLQSATCHQGNEVAVETIQECYIELRSRPHGVFAEHNGIFRRDSSFRPNVTMLPACLRGLPDHRRSSRMLLILCLFERDDIFSRHRFCYFIGGYRSTILNCSCARS